MGMLKEGKSAGVEPDECYNIMGKGDQQAGIVKKSTKKKKEFRRNRRSQASISMAIDGRSFCFCSDILCTSLKEGFENGIWLVEIVVDHVDEEASIHEFSDQIVGGGVRLIKLGPLLAEFEGLVLEAGQQKPK